MSYYSYARESGRSIPAAIGFTLAEKSFDRFPWTFRVWWAWLVWTKQIPQDYLDEQSR